MSYKLKNTEEKFECKETHKAEILGLFVARSVVLKMHLPDITLKGQWENDCDKSVTDDVKQTK